MDVEPLVEITKDEDVRFIVRKLLEFTRDKVKNIRSNLKEDDPIDLDHPNEVEEKALRQILSDPQNKKCEYILNFLRNVKKEGIDNDTACTAYGFLGHSLKEDCDIITISLKGVSHVETKNLHP